MIKKTIFLAFIVIGFMATAQIPKQEAVAVAGVFPKEKVQLSTNTNILLAGELLQYKAFSLDIDNKASKLSKIMYVSLRNENDSVVFNHKLKVENGTANGDFFIPSSLKTGIYRLIGYTNFSRNNPDLPYTQQQIFVINPFRKSSKLSGNDTDSTGIAINFEAIAGSDFNSKPGIFSIKTDKSTYGPREAVTLNIEKNNQNSAGNYVLSVRRIKPLNVSQLPLNAGVSQSSDTFYIPEIRGEIISGVVFSDENTPVANKEVSLTIPGKSYVFKLAKTNSKGRFFFSVAEGYNSENSIIQINGAQESSAKFKIVLDDKALQIGKSSLAKIKLDPHLRDWLEQRSIQMQIENAYFDIKKDSMYKAKPSATFFNSLGTVFLLDDYTRFPSVRETFIEVVTLAAIRGSDENPRFIVNNEYDPKGAAKFYDVDPLVLMDGMQIINNADLINYNAREIESIRVINSPYRYGPKIFSGIIAVETKNGDFVPSQRENPVLEFDFPPVVKGKKYYSPDYKKDAGLSRIPDYRVQLLWKPNFKPNKEPVPLTFFTSDVAGLYEMVIEGFSGDGTPILVKSYFTVSEK